MALMKHETKPEPLDLFDRFFGDRSLFRRPLLMWPELPLEDLIRVEEFTDHGTLVVKAELPGIDPEKDVEIEIYDGMLRITAERRQEEKTEEKDYSRRELRYGSFTRALPLPSGATESDVKATYKDGMLEIRVPLAAPPEPESTKVPVTKL
jgi:HSP20 family protein